MRRHGRGLAGAGLVCLISAAVPAGGPAFAGDATAVRKTPVSYASLDGWSQDDQAAAFRSFRRSCAAGSAAVAIRAACRAAARLRAPVAGRARTFFERWFEPVEIGTGEGPSTGFLTGYFEPQFDGSAKPSAAHPTPLLGPPSRSAPRPLPDRAQIEAGALAATTAPLVYLDPVDAMVVQVQGSARIRLGNGSVVRVAYAGRNGYPYTSIAKVIAEREHIPPAQMGLEALVGWLRSHPDAPALMALNRSYIFFRLAAGLRPNDGPIGGAGVPLSAGRSLAVDASVWPYGLPVWLEAELPSPDGGRAPLRRLTIAQDTGSAIVGPARGDLFVGFGRAAGREAGLLREPARFVVLMPRQDARPLMPRQDARPLMPRQDARPLMPRQDARPDPAHGP